jgi:hypothetical protein
VPKIVLVQDNLNTHKPEPLAKPIGSGAGISFLCCNPG